MEVARRLGLHVEGVSFPGHFLAKYVGDAEIIIDAFFGQVLTKRQCRERLQAVLGPDATLEPRYLETASAKEILIRMLRNLKHIYLNAAEFEQALTCCDRILLLVPNLPHELRDRGLVYQQLECYGAAVSDLERFLQLAPEDDSAAAIREELLKLSKLAARIH
jgi:regulator of sirC expression with transglutaminase-like and TPR domain